MSRILIIPAAIAVMASVPAFAQIGGTVGGATGIVTGNSGVVGGYNGAVAGGQVGGSVGGTTDTMVGGNSRTSTTPSRTRGHVNGSAAARAPGSVGSVGPMSTVPGAPPPAAGVTGDGQATVTTPPQ